MPIFYKNRKRVLFVHIPKTAGLSVSHWFIENYWYATNFSVHGSGDTKVLFDKFGIHSIPVEGIQKKGVTPQHMHAEIFSQWGAFSSAFVIVRHPLTRLLSELKYYYIVHLNNNNHLEDTEKNFIEFSFQYIDRVLNLVKQNPSVQDNHIRPQVDFLAKNLKILKFEDNWIETIAKDYDLKTPIPRLNYTREQPFHKYTLPFKNGILDDIIKFYRKDFEILNYEPDKY